MTFSGAVKTQKLPLLRDIAWTLDMSEDGTRDELIKRVSAFFNASENTHLRHNPRYKGLFMTSKRAPKRPLPAPADDELHEPPHQRRRLGEITNLSPILPLDPRLQPEHESPIYSSPDLDTINLLNDTSNGWFMPYEPAAGPSTGIAFNPPLNHDHRSILCFMGAPGPFFRSQQIDL
ncbi:hypothetical protein EV424DRAFT_1458456 [Suillus variegatus]|nr:hypothetical protein EV424DRAFT_1458456 [Suillus variegatus]